MCRFDWGAVVDGTIHEMVVIEVKRVISGTGVTRVKHLRSRAACRRSLAVTTAKGSAGRPWSPGYTGAAFSRG